MCPGSSPRRRAPTHPALASVAAGFLGATTGESVTDDEARDLGERLVAVLSEHACREEALALALEGT